MKLAASKIAWIVVIAITLSIAHFLAWVIIKLQIYEKGEQICGSDLNCLHLEALSILVPQYLVFFLPTLMIQLFVGWGFIALTKCLRRASTS
jgi:hypothetical protein